MVHLDGSLLDCFGIDGGKLSEPIDRGIVKSCAAVVLKKSSVDAREAIPIKAAGPEMRF